MNVQEKVNAINNLISDAHLLLAKVQQECEHPNLTAHYDGYSCPYDGAEYWVLINCPTCGYHKNIDSKINGERNPEYYKYTHLNKR